MSQRPSFKRKREHTLMEGPLAGYPAVAAALAGDADRLRAVLAVASEGVGQQQRALRPFHGCTPLSAAVLANSPACIRLLAQCADVNAAQAMCHESALRQACPSLPSFQLWAPGEVRFAVSPGHTPLHAALILRLFDAARALLEAGADPNAQADGWDHTTPLVALDDNVKWSPEAGADPRATSMMERLLEAGADPTLPHSFPFLLRTFPLGPACIDWLLRAHASGARPLAPPRAALALQAAIQHRHTIAYRPLLAVLQQQREQLPAGAPLRLLVQVCHHGDAHMVQDMLALGANPAAPDAAGACLLARALEQREGSQRQAVVQVLLAAKAQLGIEDLLRAIIYEESACLRRLLEMGRPQADPAQPSVILRNERWHGDRTISCPVLLNLESATILHRHAATRQVFEDVQFMHRELYHRLDIMEALGVAGYQPMQYSGTDAEGPWRYDPLQREPARFAVHGQNRLLMLALERPELGPASFPRMPPHLQAAVRDVLLIAQHGRTFAGPEHLTPEQLAVLCAQRRQQLYQKLNAQEEALGQSVLAFEFESSLLGGLQLHRLRRWAMARGWTPPQVPLPLPGAPAPAAAAPPTAQMPDDMMQRLRIPQDRRARRRMLMLEAGMACDAGRAEGAPDELVQLQGLERQLESRLMAGGMARAQLPLAPHPLRALPKELVLRILQLAVYPLAAWVQPEDFGLAIGDPAGGALPPAALLYL